jgi:hypothetical protein
VYRSILRFNSDYFTELDYPDGPHAGGAKCLCAVQSNFGTELSAKYVYLWLRRLPNKVKLVFIIFKSRSSSALISDWTTEGSVFESRQSQEFTIFYIIQTGSGVHPISYLMRTEGISRG